MRKLSAFINAFRRERLVHLYHNEQGPVIFMRGYRPAQVREVLSCLENFSDRLEAIRQEEISAVKENQI